MKLNEFSLILIGDIIYHFEKTLKTNNDTASTEEASIKMGRNRNSMYAFKILPKQIQKQPNGNSNNENLKIKHARVQITRRTKTNDHTYITSTTNKKICKCSSGRLA